MGNCIKKETKGRIDLVCDVIQQWTALFRVHV